MSIYNQPDSSSTMPTQSILRNTASRALCFRMGGSKDIFVYNDFERILDHFGPKVIS